MLTLINGAPINGASGGSIALGTAVGRARMILLTTRRVPAEPGTALAFSNGEGVAIATLVPHGETAVAAGVVGLSHREQSATGTATGRARSENQISARATMVATATVTGNEPEQARGVRSSATATAQVEGRDRTDLAGAGTASATAQTSGIAWREKVHAGTASARALATGEGETLRPTSILSAGATAQGHAQSELWMTATVRAQASARGPVPGDRLATATATARAGAEGGPLRKDAGGRSRMAASATSDMTATRYACTGGQGEARARMRTRGVRRIAFFRTTAKARALGSIDIVQLGTGTLTAVARAGGAAGKEYRATATMQAQASAQARAGIEYTMTGLPAEARASLQGHAFLETIGTAPPLRPHALANGDNLRLAMAHGATEPHALMNGDAIRLQIGTATAPAHAVIDAHAQLIAYPSSAGTGLARLLADVTPVRDALGVINARAMAQGRNYAVRHLSSRVRISSNSTAESTGGRVTVFYTGTAAAQAWLGASDDHLYVYDGWAPISRTLVVTPQTRAF